MDRQSGITVIGREAGFGLEERKVHSLHISHMRAAERVTGELDREQRGGGPA